MRVKVPRDLAGGSLLNAHRWVKSTMARENPGGSTDNYKIQETNGTPISLSDLTSRNFDEVLVISGTRTNPVRGALADRAIERGFIDANTSNYPVSSPDWSYPSYTANNRIGNNIAKLLPKNIDSSMLNRLAAQNGMFSALNTTTKLLYTNDSHHLGSQGSDPQVAALLQTYANAQKKLQHPILPNPARTFFGPDMNDGYRGVLSPDEAIKVWAGNKFEVGGSKLTNNEGVQLMDRARIIRLYDLDNSANLINFIDHVLTPYLVTSTANANLLKAMRHGKYNETTEETLGRFKGDIAETPQWKKLLAMLPMHAKDFYDGKDYALIAHPIFQRQSLAIQAMDDKLIKKIMKIVKDYPDNANDAQSPGKIRPKGQGLLDSLLPERRVLDKLLMAQQKILTTTDPSKHLELLRELYLGDSRDASIANSVREMDIGEKVSYQRDVAGFRPTPPPYWPKPVVLAVMDALKQNFHAFLKKTDRFGMAFQQLASIPNTVGNKNKKIVLKIRDNEASITLENLENIRNALNSLAAKKVMDPLALGNEVANVESATNAVIKYKGKDSLNTGFWEDVRFVIAAYLNDSSYFAKKNRQTKEGKKWKNKKRGLKANEFDGVIAVLDQMIYEYGRTTFEDIADDTLNLLSIFIEVEDTARSKYNYAMSENDRAFVLYLLEGIFDTVRVEADWGDGSGDGGPGGRSDDELVNILGHMQGPDQSLTDDQLRNRLVFNRKLSGISNRLIDDDKAGGVMMPRPTEVNEIFDRLDGEFNQSEWARKQITQEKERVLTHQNRVSDRIAALDTELLSPRLGTIGDYL